MLGSFAHSARPFCHCKPVRTLAWGAIRALPVADTARRASGSGQNFGGSNAAAKFWAPQQGIRIWPPCVKGAVSYGGIAAEIGAKNMPPACFLNAPTGGLSSIRQPLRQKSKIFATSPYTGEAFVTDSHASDRGETCASIEREGQSPSPMKQTPMTRRFGRRDVGIAPYV